ncbi:MAG: ATP-binding protein [Acidobacteriota bacterium]
MRRLLRFLSRIWLRLLAFNILLVFLPTFGILSLRTYEEHLLRMQERAMVQQGRLLAAALVETALIETAPDDAPLPDVVAGVGQINAERAEQILINLRQRQDARLRIVAPDHRLLADSSRLGPRDDAPVEIETEDDDPLPALDSAFDRALYRVGRTVYRLYDRLRASDDGGNGAAAALADGRRPFEARGATLRSAELDAALDGRYGSGIRPSPVGRSLTLYSALPVFHHERVVGAVLVSKSTVQILTALDAFRLATFKVILASMLAAVVLSLLVSTTIAQPLQRLTREAAAALDGRGRLRRGFRARRRLDEIGDLSRALAELTRRLEDRIRFLESFASDVSHEFKNPLASIRNVAELLPELDDDDARTRFTGMVLKDVARLERLIDSVREIARLDAVSWQEHSRQPVDLIPLLRGLIERFELRTNARPVRYRLRAPETPLVVWASALRMAQVFENLLDNATSFSPVDGEITVALAARGDAQVEVTIRDRGPGIAAGNLDRLFDRFFSDRPGSRNDSGAHAGLGLAIAKTIVEGYEGQIAAANHPDGGAVLTVRLPRHAALP